MAGLNGYSLSTTEIMSEWVAGIYEVQGYRPCLWTTKTLRLSSSLCDYDGVGFSELSASTSEGYAFVEQTTADLFEITYSDGSPNYEPYNATTQDLIFPIAESDWVGVTQIGIFGEGNLALSGEPEQLILGFTLDNEPGETLNITTGHEIGFLAGDIKIFLKTPYHVDP